jgi:hypothetical protein
MYTEALGWRFFRACLVLAFLTASFAHAGSVSTTQCYDTFINSLSPNNNNGGSTTFFTGEGGDGALMRALIRCDLPSALNVRATVTQATLTLTTAGLGSTGTTPPTAAIEFLSPLTQSWSEGTKAGTTMGTYTVGQPCTTGEATWNQSQCSITSWTTPGGTVTGTTSASAASPASIGTNVSFISSGGTGLAADIQNWINAPANNYGWRMLSSTEGATGQAQRFDSKESGTGPSLAILFGCKSGFVDTGTDCSACTSAAQSACITSQSGNACVDPGPPSGYYCTCGPGYTGTGTGSCTDRNECIPNQCVDAGDTGAICTDHPAPATGYDCSCDVGFVFDGTTCSDRIFADGFNA